MDGLKQQVVRGAFWVLLERFSTQGVQFAVSMLLARLLTPREYGTVALVVVFTAIASVVVDCGFGNALVQKKDATDIEFNSVFYLSLAMSVFFYFLLFFTAPLIADFYKMTEIVPIVRVMSFNLLFHAINSVQNAELNRKMLFHLSFRISLVSVISSAIVGIGMAIKGFGVWALVWSSFAGNLSGVISRWFFIAWRPKLMFSLAALRPLFKFGWKMSLSGLIETGYNNLYGLLIGRWYSSADLAYVNKGQHFPELIMNNVNGTLMRVAFPALAQMQDDQERMREAMRRMIRSSTFIIFPLMTICAITSAPLIKMLYGNQWGGAVIFAQLSCFRFALWPFHTINLQAIQALGRSDVFLHLEIVKKIIGLLFVFIFLPQGVVLFMLAVSFVSGPISVVVNSWPNRKLLKYTLLMQLKDVLPAAFLCAILAGCMLLIGLLEFNFIVLLFLQTGLGILVYVGVAHVFKCEAMKEYELLACQACRGVSAKLNKRRGVYA